MSTAKKSLMATVQAPTHGLNPMFDRVSLLPRQEEIDALGSGVGRKDWEKRFDLAYQMAKTKTSPQPWA